MAHKCKTKILFRKQKSLFESNTFSPKQKRFNSKCNPFVPDNKKRIQDKKCFELNRLALEKKYCFQKDIFVFLIRFLFCTCGPPYHSMTASSTTASVPFDLIWATHLFASTFYETLFASHDVFLPQFVLPGFFFIFSCISIFQVMIRDYTKTANKNNNLLNLSQCSITLGLSL